MRAATAARDDDSNLLRSFKALKEKDIEDHHQGILADAVSDGKISANPPIVTGEITLDPPNVTGEFWQTHRMSRANGKSNPPNVTGEITPNPPNVTGEFKSRYTAYFRNAFKPTECHGRISGFQTPNPPNVTGEFWQTHRMSRAKSSQTHRMSRANF